MYSSAQDVPRKDVPRNLNPFVISVSVSPLRVSVSTNLLFCAKASRHNNDRSDND
jgi:hypothetical protein